MQYTCAQFKKNNIIMLILTNNFPLKIQIGFQKHKIQNTPSHPLSLNSFMSWRREVRIHTISSRRFQKASGRGGLGRRTFEKTHVTFLTTRFRSFALKSFLGSGMVWSPEDEGHYHHYTIQWSIIDCLDTIVIILYHTMINNYIWMFQKIWQSLCMITHEKKSVSRL